MARGGPSRLDGLDGSDGGAPRRPGGPVAGGAQRRRARRQLRARRATRSPRSAGRDRGDDLGLCPRPRLSRRHQGQAEGARRLSRGARRCRRQGVRRHRARDGEAARRSGRARLAGQAHRAGLARVRQLAVPRRDLHDRRAAAGRRRRRTIAAPAAAASTSARRTPSRRPTGSMRGAASRTSPSSTRGTSRPSCARASATASSAATTASPCARGTSSRRRAARRGWRSGTTSPRRPSPSSPRLDDAAFRARFAGTPIKRTGRDRFVRNVLIAIGNSADPSSRRRPRGFSTTPRRWCVPWPCGRCARLAAAGGACAALAAEHAREADADVRDRMAPGGCSAAEGRGCGAREPVRLRPRLQRPALRRARIATASPRIAGTVTSRGKAERLAADGIDALRLRAGRVPIPRIESDDRGRRRAARLDRRRTRTAIRCSRASPTTVAAAPRLTWIGYLSTIGVYGDHGGGWVDETTPPEPVSARSRERLASGARLARARRRVRQGGPRLPPRRHLRSRPQRARRTSPTARRSASSSRARCSTASMSTTSPPC